MAGIGTSAATVLDSPPLLSYEGVHDALRRVAEHVVRTPVVRNEELDRLAGARLWLKAENLQRGGSFKMRGALLAVERLVAAGSAGVVAQSTGNHAIAVAMAAAEHRLPAVLVLPTDAAPTKVSRIRDAGAEVFQAGTTLAERVSLVEQLKAARGLDEIDPYQNPDVVAGQGTATAELLQQVHVAGGRLDAVVLPVGGEAHWPGPAWRPADTASTYSVRNPPRCPLSPPPCAPDTPSPWTCGRRSPTGCAPTASVSFPTTSPTRPSPTCWLSTRTPSPRPCVSS